MFFIAAASVIFGFVVKKSDPALGDTLIGLGIGGGFFVVMPLFLYHSWKEKKLKDYTLTKENLKKMREYRDSGKL